MKGLPGCIVVFHYFDNPEENPEEVLPSNYDVLALDSREDDVSREWDADSRGLYFPHYTCGVGRYAARELGDRYGVPVVPVGSEDFKHDWNDKETVFQSYRKFVAPLVEKGYAIFFLDNFKEEWELEEVYPGQSHEDRRLGSLVQGLNDLIYGDPTPRIIAVLHHPSRTFYKKNRRSVREIVDSRLTVLDRLSLWFNGRGGTPHSVLQAFYECKGVSYDTQTLLDSIGFRNRVTELIREHKDDELIVTDTSKVAGREPGSDAPPVQTNGI